jgi:hypothetical protein
VQGFGWAAVWFDDVGAARRYRDALDVAGRRCSSPSAVPQR